MRNKLQLEKFRELANLPKTAPQPAMMSGRRGNKLLICAVAEVVNEKNSPQTVIKIKNKYLINKLT